MAWGRLRGGDRRRRGRLCGSLRLDPLWLLWRQLEIVVKFVVRLRSLSDSASGSGDSASSSSSSSSSDAYQPSSPQAFCRLEQVGV